MMTKDKGGIHLPDIHKYNLVGILRHSLDWIKGTNHYSNLHLETSLVGPWSLGVLLHTRFSALPKPLRSSLILRDTVAMCKAC